MYSIDDKASFASIKEWVQIVNSERKSGSSAILLANKQDLESRQVRKVLLRLQKKKEEYLRRAKTCISAR